MGYTVSLFPFVGTKEEYLKPVAKQEIVRRTANLIKIAQWRYWLKTEVTVPWPGGWAPLDESGELHAESADPNTWYRWWLEKYVGKQGWAWDWRVEIGATVHTIGYEHLYNDQLTIKFRNPADATAFALKWA